MNEIVEELLIKESSFLDFTYKGYACRIIRNLVMFHLMGYVALERGHAFYGVSDYDINISVHGGMTYASLGRPNAVVKDTMTNKLCYIEVPYRNEPKDAWWIGFDCAHAGDTIPAMPGISDKMDTYKNIEFVKKELCEMVDQLIEREYV